MSISPTINQIMQRIKNLRQFTVNRQLPEGYAFNGQIPFDMTVKDGLAKFKVYAVDYSEAESKVDDFLKN